jgi:hypothetical protein
LRGLNDHENIVVLMSLNPRKWKRDTDSLDLSGKKLTILEQPAVQSWKTTIGKLKLGSNLLKDFPWALVASLLPNLRKLDLQQNNLSAIPDDISGFTALEELNVSNNKLVWISSEVQVLSRLRKLSLQHNCLKALPQGVTLLTDLVSLNVAHNQLRGVPLGLHALSHLRNLDLSSNLLLVQDIKLVPKECSTILGYLRSIHNSIQADQPKFSVDVASSTFLRSPNTTEPRDVRRIFLVLQGHLRCRCSFGASGELSGFQKLGTTCQGVPKDPARPLLFCLSLALKTPALATSLFPDHFVI